MSSNKIIPSLLLCTALLQGCDEQSDKPASQDAASPAQGKRVIVIDPQTGERRAPSAVELENSKQRTLDTEKPAPKVVENEDGSTTVYFNGQMRKPLKAKVDENGEQEISH